jgi:hypothetical protein
VFVSQEETLLRRVELISTKNTLEIVLLQGKIHWTIVQPSVRVNPPRSSTQEFLGFAIQMVKSDAFVKSPMIVTLSNALKTSTVQINPLKVLLGSYVKKENPLHVTVIMEMELVSVPKVW